MRWCALHGPLGGTCGTTIAAEPRNAGRRCKSADANGHPPGKPRGACARRLRKAVVLRRGICACRLTSLAGRAVPMEASAGPTRCLPDRGRTRAAMAAGTGFQTHRPARVPWSIQPVTPLVGVNGHPLHGRCTRSAERITPQASLQVPPGAGRHGSYGTGALAARGARNIGPAKRSPLRRTCSAPIQAGISPGNGSRGSPTAAKGRGGCGRKDMVVHIYEISYI